MEKYRVKEGGLRIEDGELAIFKRVVKVYHYEKVTSEQTVFKR